MMKQMAILVADDEADGNAGGRRQCWWQMMKQMAMLVVDDEADDNAGGGW